MNTQNNEHDRLVNLLAEKSHDDITHVIQTHLKNRFGDQEVIDAVIDYASALERVKFESRNNNSEWGGDKVFVKGRPIRPIQGDDAIERDEEWGSDKKVFIKDRPIQGDSFT